MGIVFRGKLMHYSSITRSAGYHEWLSPQTFYTTDNRDEEHELHRKTRDGEIRGVIFKK